MTALPAHDQPGLQTIQFAGATGIDVDVLRLDLIHPVISGNKWFKLKGHWPLIQQSSGTVVTFGGAWSNHLIATACAARLCGLHAVGIVRGEEPPRLSDTLKAAREFGMDLQFISRSQYARRTDNAVTGRLSDRYPGAYIIPEGGGGPPGILGCRGILQTVDSSPYTHFCCAVGTGTMLFGLALGATAGQTVIGVPVLKGIDTLAIPDAGILTPVQRARMRILSGYHFGGYARHPAALLEFMNAFYRDTGIPTDIVYTGKLFYAIRDAVINKSFPPGSKLLVVHSGGLQGNRSLPAGALQF